MKILLTSSTRSHEFADSFTCQCYGLHGIFSIYQPNEHPNPRDGAILNKMHSSWWGWGEGWREVGRDIPVSLSQARMPFFGFASSHPRFSNSFHWPIFFNFPFLFLLPQIWGLNYSHIPVRLARGSFWPKSFTNRLMLNLVFRAGIWNLAMVQR